MTPMRRAPAFMLCLRLKWPWLQLGFRPPLVHTKALGAKGGGTWVRTGDIARTARSRNCVYNFFLDQRIKAAFLPRYSVADISPVMSGYHIIICEPAPLNREGMSINGTIIIAAKEATNQGMTSTNAIVFKVAILLLLELSPIHIPN